MGVRFLGELYSQKDIGVGDSTEEPTLSYTDIFYQCLPHYLAMGMSADEFWNCDPRMYKVYREKDRLENERKNELLWMAGAYVREAIASTFSSENDPHSYPDKPFDLGLRNKDEDMTVEEIQRTPQYIHFVDWVNNVNKQKRGENDGR